MTIAQDKADLRARMKAVRAAFTEIERDAARDGLTRHADRLAQDHAIIAGFFPLAGELDPRPLLTALRERGVEIALPRMQGKDQPLSFRKWEEGAALTEGAFGVMEPGADAPLLTPDLILAPLLAADRQGGRLGYGGGFYDRTIAHLKAEGRALRVIGLAYPSQLVEKVPDDAQDQRLDGILTPAEWIEID